MIHPTESLRDYAFDELPAAERREMELHLAECDECSLELDSLRLTTAALRILPDREIPQRIAFVSDRVFKPSRFSVFWNSAARLGFASACVLAVALVVSAAWKRPTEIRTVVQTSSSATTENIRQQIDASVARAVQQVRLEDAKMTQAAIQQSEQKQDRAFRDQMIAVQENYSVLQRRLGATYTALASNDIPGAGAGQ
jgi:hypothetical protein